MNKKGFRWESSGAVGILTLDRVPENYLAQPEFIPLDFLKEQLTPEIKGLVITGAGRHFSAGADPGLLFKQAADSGALREQVLRGNQLLDFIDNLDIPVVTAISGICFGGGLEIALACDLRFCTQRSLFAFPEIHLDLIPALGGVRRLQNLCGHRVALELLFRGDTINAHKAAELKIADLITEQKDVREFAVDYLAALVKDRPLKVIRMLMKSFRNAESGSHVASGLNDAEMFCELSLAASNAGQIQSQNTDING